MRRYLLLVFAVLLLLPLGVFSTASADPLPAWTFMVYLDADNNLESAGIDDFLEMATVGSDANINIVVQFDRINGYDTSYGDWTRCKRFYIEKDMTPIPGNAVEGLGEVNMGNPETLVDFVEWTVTSYPAEKYALVLWNHGDGWRQEAIAGAEKTPASKQKVQAPKDELVFKAVCWDDTNGDVLSMDEVQQALSEIQTQTGEIMNLIGFDACLMSMMEVAYEIRDYGAVMVGSEETEPLDGWPYDTILAGLRDNPDWSAPRLGRRIVNRYYASYGNSYTQSAITLSHANSLATSISTFAQTMRDDHTDESTVKAAAQSVMDKIDSAVIHEQHGVFWPGSLGLAIYFPETSWAFDPDYNGTVIDFPADTVWDEFLADYYASMGDSWIAACRTVSQEYAVSGHIDLYDFCRNLVDYEPCLASYIEEPVPHEFIGGGTAMTWNDDDESWLYTLPFAFPFYCSTYDEVYVCSNGFLDFTNANPDWGNSTSELTSRTMIAPLWDDLKTDGSAQPGEDIYIDESPGSVRIRWQAETWTNGNPVNVEVILFEDGRIQFNYGAGNTGLSPTIGISAGDGSAYDLCVYNGSSSLAEVDSVMFTPVADKVGFCHLTEDTLKNKFYLRNDDGTTTIIGYKKASDLLPIAGDWDGDGNDEVGLFELAGETSMNNKFYLRNDDGTTTVIEYKEQPIYIPITGDWDGDGDDEVGLCEMTNNIHKNKFYLRADDGTTTVIKYKKLTAYTPITGDWDGDGADEVGFCDRTDDSLKNRFYLRNSDGTTTAIKYKKLDELLPITGDWDNDGSDEIGFCHQTNDSVKNRFYLRNDDGTTTVIRYRKPQNYLPITGNWDGN